MKKVYLISILIFFVGLIKINIDLIDENTNLQSHNKKLIVEHEIDQEHILVLDQSINDLFKEKESWRLRALNVGTRRVKVSFYHPKSGGINADKDPGVTATGTKPTAGWTVAISRDLIEPGFYGKKIYVEGWGMFKTEDLLNDKQMKRHGGAKIRNQIDICVGSLDDIPKKGVFENVLISIID